MGKLAQLRLALAVGRRPEVAPHGLLPAVDLLHAPVGRVALPAAVTRRTVHAVAGHRQARDVAVGSHRTPPRAVLGGQPLRGAVPAGHAELAVVGGARPEAIVVAARGAPCGAGGRRQALRRAVAPAGAEEALAAPHPRGAVAVHASRAGRRVFGAREEPRGVGGRGGGGGGGGGESRGES